MNFKKELAWIFLVSVVVGSAMHWIGITNYGYYVIVGFFAGGAVIICRRAKVIHDRNREGG